MTNLEVPALTLSPANNEIWFSENNHWRFGWGGGLYNYDEQHLPLWASFGPCRRTPKRFDEEVAITARKIATKAEKPLYVAMSGGIDSELVARTMLQEKIPFTPLIAQYEEDYNKADAFYAFEFCRQNNLTPEVVKLDILAFFKNCINTPYVLANCAHIMQMHLMRQAARLGGMAVICVGEQRYTKQEHKKFVSVPIERIAVTHFMAAEGIQGVSAFYCYTPEMMLSFLREAREHGFKKMGRFAHEIKKDIYHKFWPEMIERPKFSGFEAVREQRRVAQDALCEKYGERIVTVKMPVKIFEKQLIGNRILGEVDLPMGSSCLPLGSAR